MAPKDGARGAPPRAPFTLSVGVTGHRSDALTELAARAAADRLDEVLGTLATAARRVAEQQAAFFAPLPPRFTFASPLADGADQIAAEIALAKGFKLHAILPFPRADYELDFEERDAVSRYRALLGQASRVLELPGQRSHALEAYVMAGRATVAHSDLLVAVWDGLPARGRGGTGEVVELALMRGTPIIHVPNDETAPVTLIWSGLDPHVVTTTHNRKTAEVPLNEDNLTRLLTDLLAPPTDEQEWAFVRTFYAERERNLRPRIEYPLLLALAGIRRLRRSSWRAEPYAEATRAEWSPFRQECAGRFGLTADLDRLEDAYCWADRLAQHFGHSYRSGHVFNFLFAALAVLLALTAWLVPGIKLFLAFAELAVILAVIGNTHIGTRQGWHRRWLDYRQLAERLRPMRSLSLLALAAPDLPEGGVQPRPKRWIDWYAAAVWRDMGPPAGRMEAEQQAGLIAGLAAQEIRPQIDYHRANAHQLETLDHRLHLFGTSLFAATVVGCIVLIAGLLFFYDRTVELLPVFLFISAGLPALGTAIFGIRVQGDFAGTAQRSRSTAAQLEKVAHALEQGDVALWRGADLFEQAARAMLADLAEWRLAHQQHELAIPA